MLQFYCNVTIQAKVKLTVLDRNLALFVPYETFKSKILPRFSFQTRVKFWAFWLLDSHKLVLLLSDQHNTKFKSHQDSLINQFLPINALSGNETKKMMHV
jgi:hypothetical protein